MTRLVACAASLLLLAGVVSAAEKKLTHCFYFTVIEAATQADWDAFYKATDALPSKIPGLTGVSYGKLVRPLTLYAPDREAAKKLRAGEKGVTGQINQQVRQFGVCMQFESEAALKAYAPDPAHKEWEAIYSKVRVAGTTTIDFIAP
jgi:hypothetical protein